MSTRAVLFDLDDTLFDHSYCTLEALGALRGAYACFQRWTLAELAAQHNRMLDLFHIEVLAGRMTVDEARIKRFGVLVSAAGAGENVEDAAKLAGDYRRAYVAAWRLVPGARELLDALHPQAPIGVVSNNVVGEQLDKITACGLSPYLDTVAISEEAGAAKPDPRIFEIALARLGCNADETVMVGDSWTADITGARAAGMRAVWFNRLGLKSPEPGEVAEVRSFEPVQEVITLLLGR